MTDNSQNEQDWQQKTLENLLLENLKEQRRKRKWSIFFKLVLLVFLITVFLALFFGEKSEHINRTKPHTALVNIRGMIMPSSSTSARTIITGLNDAFKDPNTRGVILNINSPGGSPVQSAYVYNAIMRLRDKYPHIKIYAVCSDICTSGAYYIAAATNDIYTDQSSLVGSIGVMLNGFGFVDGMKKLGVERRLLIAGSEKGFLDPFTPLKEQDVKYAKKMLGIVHQQFINSVKKGRGQRLKNSPNLFSGLAWTGVQAKEMGLIDGFGSVYLVSRDVIKNTNIIDYTKKPDFFHRISESMGASFAKQMVASFSGNKLIA